MRWKRLTWPDRIVLTIALILFTVTAPNWVVYLFAIAIIMYKAH